MYCGHCGAQNQDDYKFCKACGADLRTPPPTDDAGPALTEAGADEQAAPMSMVSMSASSAPKTDVQRLFSYLTPVVWVSSILWGLFGVGQALSGLIAPQESTTVGGVINLPGGFWMVVIGALNLAGAVAGIVQLRRAGRGDEKAVRTLRDTGRSATIFLGLQALGVVSVGGTAGLICFGPVIILEGIVWCLGQRLLTRVG